MAKTHCLTINTQKGIFELDGVSLAGCVTGCEVKYSGGEQAIVTLKLISDIVLEDNMDVRKEMISQVRSGK